MCKCAMCVHDVFGDWLIEYYPGLNIHSICQRKILYIFQHSNCIDYKATGLYIYIFSFILFSFSFMIQIGYSSCVSVLKNTKRRRNELKQTFELSRSEWEQKRHHTKDLIWNAILYHHLRRWTNNENDFFFYVTAFKLFVSFIRSFFVCYKNSFLIFSIFYFVFFFFLISKAENGTVYYHFDICWVCVSRSKQRNG